LDYGDILPYEMKIDQAPTEIKSILDSWNIKDSSLARLEPSVV
jgi:hypothetical protein